MTKDKTANGKENIQTWIDSLKPEHSLIAIRVDGLIRTHYPDIICHTKWHKPSQPLGIPFYGLPNKGWMFALWSFKNHFSVGFIAGTLLNPEPAVTKMSGPWNKNTEYKGRRIDIKDLSDCNESLLDSWFIQAKDLPGWSKIE
ncbi:DUF1801 domain-containing protein [Flavobacterium agrisoli]|uniref:DUF1801 domain-containing protein n=1 Tax=Flavobacterium agrisoli TaxID=2793066 RepID=A0A934UL11_9FLAO|nr:DUF1801 domain-containing protein [Flavobacterium agrisoli]MBK0371133.1 DUF1801 domain-containing protein [Flavobacterium agrisoli]